MRALFMAIFLMALAAEADAQILVERCDTAWSAERFFDCIFAYATPKTKAGREWFDAMGTVAAACLKETGTVTKQCVGEKIRNLAIMDFKAELCSTRFHPRAARRRRRLRADRS